MSRCAQHTTENTGRNAGGTENTKNRGTALSMLASNCERVCLCLSWHRHSCRWFPLGSEMSEANEEPTKTKDDSLGTPLETPAGMPVPPNTNTKTIARIFTQNICFARTSKSWNSVQSGLANDHRFTSHKCLHLCSSAPFLSCRCFIPGPYVPLPTVPGRAKAGTARANSTAG